MIKYKFAYDSQQKIIDIQTLSKATKQGNFICLGCGHEMLPVLGEKKVNHFRHKVIKEVNCSPETYLHKLIKTKFYELYQNCLDNNRSFKIRISTNWICNLYEQDFLTTYKLDNRIQEFDLTKFFKKIYLERRESSFIPDVLLEANNQEKLFFEVVVTHLSTRNKIESNYRIIEFIATSEEDCKIIESGLFEESDKIKFINFKRYQKGNICEGKCYRGIHPSLAEKLLYNAFVIYKNGKKEYLKGELDEIESLRPQLSYLKYISLEEYIRGKMR